MSLFGKIKIDNTSFNTPQEMYLDNRRKRINGALDYQSKMIDSYMKEGYNSANVALELPTGAGKTLIGLLIGEFRRRKNGEKILYVCPNNQLVNQVVDKANNLYGIKAVAFTGKVKDYSPKDKSAFNRAEVIGVTNYSSLFINGTFFEDPNVIIFDDAHGAENYIASQWSLVIDKSEHNTIFNALVECIKSELDYTQYSYIKGDNLSQEVWIDKLSNIKFHNKIPEIIDLLNAKATYKNKLIYSWDNIKFNLQACNMFLSKDKIAIRPYIPPTMTHSPFRKATQRIYMSATLGISGELERTIGVSKIKRLPMVDDWNEKSIGRRYFVFPNASFTSKEVRELFVEMNKELPRSLLLVQDNKAVERFVEAVKKDTALNIYTINDLNADFSNFTQDDNAIAILANRYDGIDLEGDKCNLLFISQLPNGTGLQESFLSERLAASLLFEERIRTKLIQAIGRCTRSNTDYAIVCIMGDQLLKVLTARKKIEKFPPELRAELEFGYTYSENLSNFDNILLSMRALIDRTDDWDDAEDEILALRDKFKEENVKDTNSEMLGKAAELEVEFQYALWREDYFEALEKVDLILTILNGEALIGYKSFWNYVAGYTSYLIYKKGECDYFNVMERYFDKASKNSFNITWFKKVIPTKEKSVENSIDNGLMDIIERLEEQIFKDGFKSNIKFEKKVDRILAGLHSDNGTTFENAFMELGILLGYESGNSDGHTSPDPWWTINNDYCVVSESKIYTGKEPKIKTNDVRQALTHEKWIKSNLSQLNRDCKINTIFVTTTLDFEYNADVYGENLKIVLRDELIAWAESAINSIRKLRRIFNEKGDMLWRLDAQRILEEDKHTPKNYIDFVNKRTFNTISN
ncbi:DEAD/DEAH box helicase family protein [Lysinibacillus sphaericus]|uniref:DEAD/DEAH box helicase family protein n=1 Tax=Lysinibacillus sphaericus TaxID=1421 RepID=UPI00248C84BF|nr:DEAD/DEAH box helicase family protein [Lysinibacillus sphaericus]